MPNTKRTDPTIDQIARFMELSSRMTLSNRVQQRYVTATNLVGRSELWTLRALGRHGPLTYNDLTARLRLERTSVSRLAARLVEAELIRRDIDENDKRKAWLSLTAAGEEVLQRIEDVYLEYYEVAISDWTPEERAATREALEHLQDCLTHLEFDESGRAVRVAPRPDPKDA